ncbi:hypothetical protein K491DRAFT_686851 [Lophiostoma macrostomum CBS 122681]|uniref:SP-RING-type domain-containing protein n=1 Tax=Lophiostoma macrostomum CBS 122681 TaxID=1314788 RepID=A0A6A6TP82_9PLEO|nr:hypothetical protein K491DRAFT_686851 [Lophiostoma macrostomum CBS 122681]
MNSGRRPSLRDADATPTRADQAATQDTLHYALGNLGGKQKSWMKQNEAPNTSLSSARTLPVKRKRGRPAIYTIQQTTAPTSPEIGRPRDRHPPSNSTSPQLANLVSPQIRSPRVQRQEPVLPSPSPSLDAYTDSVSAPTAQQTGNSHAFNAQQPSLRGGHGTVESPCETSPNIVFMRELQTAAEGRLPPPSKRPRREPLPLQLVAQSDMQEERASPISLTPDQTHPHPVHNQSAGITHSRSPSYDLRQTSLLQASQALLNRPEGRVGSHHQPHGTPPQVQSPFGLPQSVSRERIQDQTFASASPTFTAERPQGSASALARPSRSDSLTMPDCHAILTRFTSHHTSRLNSRDSGRLDVLRDAINRGDWDYLTMHQYYCLMDLDRQSLSPSIVNHPNFESAYRLMGIILDANSLLHPSVLSFFANFPVPLTQLAVNWPRAYEQQQQMFVRFMPSAANYSHLEAVCQQRGFPPLAGELSSGLGVWSPTFQRTVFTAILRRIWGQASLSDPVLSRFERDAQSMLMQNQLELEAARKDRPPNADATWDEQMRNREQVSWGGQLKQLCAKHEVWLRSRGLRLPTRATISQQQTRAPPHNSSRLVHSPLTTMPPQTQGMPPLRHQVIPSQQHSIHRGRGRPPLNHVVPSQHAVRSQRPQAAPSRPNAALLPPRGWIQPQQRIAIPSRWALHDASLRSPVLRARSKPADLYQYVTGFAIPPTRFTKAVLDIERWTLVLPPEHARTIPPNVLGAPGEPPSRTIDESSQLFRLRCIKWPFDKLPDKHAWATADTSWTSYAYFTFNGTAIHPRKKLHHGKDLPMDLSGLMKEGENTLEVTIMQQPDDQTYLKYLVAVEVVGLRRYDEIKRECVTMRHVSASDALAAIRAKLSEQSDDDDDLCIVQSNLTVSLVDPFSASVICDIPVRSKACLHIDCFDLETFLSTRKRKDDASVADIWKCPICNADARPQHLLVDGFLQDVRKQLEQHGLSNTRAIIVDQDGTWKPKIEPGNANDSRDSNEPEDMGHREAQAHTSRARSTPVDAQIIDLSD